MVPSAMARPTMANPIRSLHPDDAASPNGKNDSFSINSRFGPQKRPVAEERSSSIGLAQGIGNGANAWSDSKIWGQDAWASAGTREHSRSREPSYLGQTKEVRPETATGSGALKPDSGPWDSIPSPWKISTPPGSQLRSRGVSPVGRHTDQSLVDSQNSFPSFTTSHTLTAVGQKPVNGTYDAQLAGQRYPDMTNGYGHQSRVSDASSIPRDFMRSYADNISPTEERQTVDYLRASSTASNSRTNSQPPSRHESSQFNQGQDPFLRFGQTPVSTARGHTSSISSLSNGRFPSLDRTNSQPNDSLPTMFGGMSLDNDQGGSTLSSSNGNSRQNSVQELRNLQAAMANNAYIELKTVEGTFTPQGYPTFQDPFRQSRFGERGGVTAAANNFQQSPGDFYSTGATPQSYDQTYSSRTEQPRTYANVHPAVLERRLRSLQQQDHHQQPMMHYAPYQPSLMNPHQQRYNPYATQYQLPPAIPMSGIGSGMALPSPHPSMYPSRIEAPRGPRGEQETQHLQSPLLAEFKASSKCNRRWELKDIYTHLVEFSGDQYGSRFIQQKLETANSDEKSAVFDEIMPDVMQLMTDVFGNYVIQKFFEHGDMTQKRLLANKMKGQVMNLSLQMYACRVVQKALEHVLSAQQAELVKELEPHVIRCVKDQNGNHVVQKAIERVDGQHIQFILDSFDGKVGELANHAYGCRVIQRVLEHCNEPAKRRILSELHACGSTLISDQYGNYVTQHMIQFGNLEDRAKVIDLVKAKVVTFSKHKFASNVVETCLKFGTPLQRREMMEEFVKQADSLCDLIKDSYGNYVVQKFLDQLEGADYDAFIEYLQPEMIKAKKTVSGKQIAAVEKKMHKNRRFDSPTNVHASPTATMNGASLPSFGIPQISNPPSSSEVQSPQGSTITPAPIPAMPASSVAGALPQGSFSPRS